MPLRSDLLDPIAGPNPAGANLRYEPIYDQIKHARIEEDEIPQGDWKRARKTADYGQVVKLASEVLAEKSKDLQIAAWLTEALIHREGFGGLGEGLELIRGYLEQFWDHVYPELDDGDAEIRAAPLEWVGQYLEDAVKSVPLNRAGHGFYLYRESRQLGYEEQVKKDSSKYAEWQKAVEAGKISADEFDEEFTATPKPWYKQLVADVEGAIEALERLETVCDEKFGRDAPSFIRLRDDLKEVKQVAGQLLARKLELEPDPVEPEAVAMADETALADDPGAAADAGAPAAGGGGISAQPRDREDAAARVAAAARFMRAETPTDPAPYLMLRGLRWGELRAGGSHVDPRLLAAPATEVRTRLKTMLLDGRWRDLLEAAEEVMATPYGRGWLDLQRYVLTACDGLGGEYDNVAAAMRGALRSLLRDVPGLLDYTLMDDSPTANAETRGWLGEAGLLPGGGEEDEAAGAAAAPATPAPGVYGPVEREVERLRQVQPQRAIELLMREASKEKSARARFLRRSQAASVMVEAGLESVAVPLLQEMMEAIERFKLEEWEAGETIAHPMAMLYRCLEKLDGDASTRQELYLRVCRLDPMQAINFAAKRPQDDEPGG